MPISERLCCCLDAATGSILTGMYTGLLSLIFLAIGVDSLVETSRGSHHRGDLVTLNVVYGLLIGSSIFYLVSSIALVLGASKKLKSYVIMWMVLTPLWTLLALSHLVILPAELSLAVRLTNSTTRICGAVFLALMNTFCMVCVCVFMSTLFILPKRALKSVSVLEALETGFSAGYSRLRESIRPSSKPGHSARYWKESSADKKTTEVTIPDIKVSVVLDPNSLEVPRPQHTHKKEYESPWEDDGFGNTKMNQSLAQSEQHMNQPGGLSNPAFSPQT